MSLNYKSASEEVPRPKGFILQTQGEKEGGKTDTVNISDLSVWVQMAKD